MAMGNALGPNLIAADPRLSRRSFLRAATASLLALAATPLAGRAAHACDYGACYQGGWTCAWNGWEYDWFSITDCYDALTGQFCGEFWIDSGVPC